MKRIGSMTMCACTNLKAFVTSLPVSGRWIGFPVDVCVDEAGAYTAGQGQIPTRAASSRKGVMRHYQMGLMHLEYLGPGCGVLGDHATSFL